MTAGVIATNTFTNVRDGRGVLRENRPSRTAFVSCTRESIVFHLGPRPPSRDPRETLADPREVAAPRPFFFAVVLMALAEMGEESPVPRHARGGMRGESSSQKQYRAMDTTTPTPATALTRNNGRFAAGYSGNPGGVPKKDREVVSLAKEQTAFAIRRLVELASSANEFVALSAVTALLDRGWGRPTQSLAVDVTDATRQAELAMVVRELGGMSFRKDAIDVEVTPVEESK